MGLLPSGGRWLLLQTGTSAALALIKNEGMTQTDWTIRCET